MLGADSSQQPEARSILGGENSEIAGPLDQVSSADIAVNVARLTYLPEATSVVNHADSVNATLLAPQADNSIVAKPAVIDTSLPTKYDIQRYVVQAGDTISKIARKHGVSSDSVRWSNGLTGDDVDEGKALYLPPAGFEGIVYKVKADDTPEKLAEKYNTNKDDIVSFNDAEITGLVAGDRIVVPNGTVARAPEVNYTFYIGNAGGGYDPGWCTDYASRVGGAPGGWGNANTWAFYAARTPGWKVSTVPRVGAIAQSNRGWAGHVGIVDAVSEDGTKIKYSDMNGLAGFGRIGHSDWVPAHSAFQNFIFKD